MTYTKALLAFLIILLAACNNNRSQRLNASFYCKPDRDDVKYEPSEKELETLKAVDLPDDERLVATNFITSVELIDTNGVKVFANLSGVVVGDNASVSTTCTRGLTIDSILSEPAVFTVPIKNGSGDFTEVEITIEGRAGENKNLPFGTVKTKVNKPIESAADNTDIKPRSFSLYFMEEQTAAYQATKGSNKDTEFRYHIVNEDLSENFIKATTRMSLTKVSEKK